MAEKEQNGSGQGSTEQRLKAAVEGFHAQAGMNSKWKLDDEKFRACLNLLVGTSSKARLAIQCHLNFHKWSHSAFTADLLRSARWLIGASPRNARNDLKKMLTVTEEVQCDFLANVVRWFNRQAKKTRLSSRGKLRLSSSEWDKLVDYTCVMHKVMELAREALADHEQTKIQDLVEPEVMGGDAITEADVEAVEEATAQAQFNELRSKIALIEDKCASLNLALRDVRIALDTSCLHGNADRPGNFQGWVAVCDTALPLKGIWHRRASHDDTTKPVAVNPLTSSELWKLQGFAWDKLPKAVAESDFVVPSQRSFFTSNESRRNLTDQQETSQWVTGQDLFSHLFEALLGSHIASAAVVHTTAYDGMVERACLEHKMPVLSVTDQPTNHSFAMVSIANMLLENWKNGVGELGKYVPRYLANPPDSDQPDDLEAPSFKVCEIKDGYLTIPQQIRSSYASCPIRAPEWRALLADFNKKWGQVTDVSAPAAAAATARNQNAVVPAAAAHAAEEQSNEGQEQFNWGSVFPDEPTNKADFDQKYPQQACTFALTNSITGIIVEGPKLFLMATADSSYGLSEPVILFGAGTWLLDGKASAYDEAWLGFRL
eukprot:Skav201663  [mRNA]  locus=scaffold641:262503:266404:- [translate_table: standard]